jgi:choline transport protein
VTIAVVVIVVLVNIFGARALPTIEAVALALLGLGFLGCMIPLWALSPVVPASVAFGEFSNFGG